jgi:hypothetical protein
MGTLSNLGAVAGGVLQGMAGRAADVMRNRNARIEAELKRQMGE